MQKTANIYIDSLRFGINNMELGISCNELKEYLRNIGWKIEGDFEGYLTYWFFTHFYYKSAYTTLKNGNASQVHGVIQDATNSWMDVKCPMSYDAYEMFLDHEKLKVAREDSAKALSASTQATRYAKIALIIGIIVGGLQIILQIISLTLEQKT